MYELIRDRLAQSLLIGGEISTKDSESEKNECDAAVLIPILKKTEPEILLTLRARHLNSHGGEVALPGGKVDEEDASLIETALRETNEEVGIHTSHIEIIGGLKPKKSRFGLAVKPYIGLVDPQANIVANQDELSEVFSVPVAFFRDNEPKKQTNFEGNIYNIPSYEYDGYNIWGLTAFILMDFVYRVFEE